MTWKDPCIPPLYSTWAPDFFFVHYSQGDMRRPFSRIPHILNPKPQTLNLHPEQTEPKQTKPTSWTTHKGTWEGPFSCTQHSPWAAEFLFFPQRAPQNSAGNEFWRALWPLQPCPPPITWRHTKRGEGKKENRKKGGHIKHELSFEMVAICICIHIIYMWK